MSSSLKPREPRNVKGASLQRKHLKNGWINHDYKREANPKEDLWNVAPDDAKNSSISQEAVDTSTDLCTSVCWCWASNLLMVSAASSSATCVDACNALNLSHASARTTPPLRD